jgi:hypothetical protein
LILLWNSRSTGTKDSSEGLDGERRSFSNLRNKNRLFDLVGQRQASTHKGEKKADNPETNLSVAP